VHRNRALQIVAKMDREIRDCFKRTNVNLLTSALLGIGRQRFNQRGEIAQSVEIQSRQNVRAKKRQIDPFVRGVLGSPVVKVESVYVHVRSEDRCLQKQSRLSAARALSPKIEGVLMKIYCKCVGISIVSSAQVTCVTVRKLLLEALVVLNGETLHPPVAE